MADVVLVVPCYEEAKRLKSERFLAALDAQPDLRYLFVDDGSRDGTLEVLEGLRARRGDRVAVLRLDSNVGKGEAVRAGMLAALADGEPDYVGFWDADLATPLEEVPRFVARFAADPTLVAVLGSRIKMLGRQIERKLQRHLVGRFFATLISNTLGLPVYDTQCGAKIFRVDPQLGRALETPFLARWVFDVELLARLRDLHAEAGVALEDVIIEEPLKTWRDLGGSKLRPFDAALALRDIGRIRVRYPKP